MTTDDKTPELRKPFSDVYSLFIRFADQQGFPHSFDFDDALAVAQRLADQRAQGSADAEDFRRIGELPYLMLSYLGQAPPERLLLEFKARLERLSGYIESGSLKHSLADVGIGDTLESVTATRDMSSLRKKWIKQVEGAPPSEDTEIVEMLGRWTALVVVVMVEFLKAPAPPPLGNQN